MTEEEETRGRKKEGEGMRDEGRTPEKERMKKDGLNIGEPNDHNHGKTIFVAKLKFLRSFDRIMKCPLLLLAMLVKAVFVYSWVTVCIGCVREKTRGDVRRMYARLACHDKHLLELFSQM